MKKEATTCVLVCVTAQVNCERLIAQGQKWAGRLHTALRVLHVASDPRFLQEPQNAAVLDRLFSMAHEADAEMEILCAAQAAEAIARYARKEGALRIVLGAGTGDFARRLRSLLPGAVPVDEVSAGV